jgi:hypothetical protein
MVPARRIGQTVRMATADDVRELAYGFPRSYEVFVRGRWKFRVGQIVYLSFSKDETLIGFAFPREERAWLVASRPDTFLMPRPSDLRFQWVVARLGALELAEMHELVYDAWRMVVPKRVALEYAEGHREAAYVRDIAEC